jgi:hypothetical protein
MPGIKIRNGTYLIGVVAYADDVTIFVTATADFAIIEEAINLFEQVSGLRLNPRKSKALATGSWNTPETIRGIEFFQSITILRVNVWGTARSQWTTHGSG